jgi:hypothetical protein
MSFLPTQKFSIKSFFFSSDDDSGSTTMFGKSSTSKRPSG